MKSERPPLPADAWLYIETARSIGADEAELASLLSRFRERMQFDASSDTVQATLMYAKDLAEHVSAMVELHQLSLPLEVVAASRRIGKELDWIEQDLLIQRQLWQTGQTPSRREESKAA